MKKILLSLFVLTAIGVVNSYGQDTEVEVNKAEAVLSKRIKTNTIKANNSDQKRTHHKEKSAPFDIQKKKSVANQEGGTNYSASKPATRTSEVKYLSSIEYSIDPSKSDLSNLLSLTELKQEINQTSPALLNTPEYSKLEKDIEDLKSEFNNRVQSQGVKNCSILEQSHYLAFLKEDGKMEEYSTIIQELK